MRATRGGAEARTSRAGRKVEGVAGVGRVQCDVDQNGVLDRKEVRGAVQQLLGLKIPERCAALVVVVVVVGASEARSPRLDARPGEAPPEA